MAVEGRKEAKEKERMEEEEFRGQKRKMMKSKIKKKAYKRMELRKDDNLNGPDQLLICKNQFSLEGGRDTNVGESFGLVVEGLETMPSEYAIHEHSQDLEENVAMQYMDGTMFQGVDLAPGPVVTSLEGGGGGEKK